MCARCHVVPKPDVLSKREWSFALSLMAMFVGQELGKGDTGLHFGEFHRDAQLKRRLRQVRRHLAGLKLVPPRPVVSDSDWRAVRAYYVSAAPKVVNLAPAPASKPLTFFDSVDHDYVKAKAFTSLVKIDSKLRRVFVGDIGIGSRSRQSPRPTPSLAVVSSAGKLQHTLTPAGSPIDVHPRDDGGIDLALMGNFFPNANKPNPGRYVRYQSLTAKPVTLIDGMPRTANMVPVDVDGDGRTELVGSGFGYGLLTSGGVSVYRPKTGGGYDETPLWRWPGVLRVEVTDVDQDGHVDVLALAAGAREGLYLLRGPLLGRAVKAVPILERHPAFGFTHMQLADVNKDGKLDVIVVNGDNTDGDLHNSARPYHGVRVLLNEGRGRFREAYFFPMQGASMVAVDDFDGDGDVDLAVVAAYPDLAAPSVRSFVLLQQTKSMEFAALSHPAAAKGRWLTIDSGDVDGDGDPDIVLGGFHYPLGVNRYSKRAMTRLAAMAKDAPPILILRNRTKP